MGQYKNFRFTLVTDPGPSIYSTAGSISGTPVSSCGPAALSPVQLESLSYSEIFIPVAGFTSLGSFCSLWPDLGGLCTHVSFGFSLSFSRQDTNFEEFCSVFK
jgi:hypothetical protein